MTKGAFCRARLKFNHSTFIELNEHLIALLECQFEIRSWLGFLVLTIDSVTLHLPNTPDIVNHFGIHEDVSLHCCPLARASQIYDCLNRVTLDAIIHPYKVDERDKENSENDYKGQVIVYLSGRNG